MELLMPLLNTGDTFPTIKITTHGDHELVLPNDLRGAFGVVLFYRGSWCPYCNAQLLAFQRARDALAEVDARVVALSVDDDGVTSELIAKHKLTFPIGHSADAAAVSAVTGAFLDPSRGCLQSTGFVLDPDGKVAVSVYSSRAIGRLVPQDVVGMIRYLVEHAPSATA